jgi:hypothetical protein
MAMSSKIQLIAQSKNKAGGAKNFELTAGMGDDGQAIRVQAESGVRYELLDLTSWTAAGTNVVANGETYVVYNHNTSAQQLLIDQGILVSAVL